MARTFIKDLRAGERIEDDVFLIQSKDLRTTTQGNLYIHAILADRSGHLVARHWQATEELYAEMVEGGFLRFKGRVENYKGNPQFIIDGMRAAEPDSFDIADFLPSTSKDVGHMWERLQQILGTVSHPDLAALIAEFLADKELMGKFRRAPAAATMHHAYIGGLLEHTLQLLELAMVTVPMYPELNLDLMLTGLFLHDIGKSTELTFESNIGYSDEGQLVGHSTQAVIWIAQKVAALSKLEGRAFPDSIRMVLQHLVLSHHGRYEFGSPKLPAIPEAVAIHFLDNLDAKLNMFIMEIAKDRDGASHWTNYNRALETKIYKPDVMGTQATQPNAG